VVLDAPDFFWMTRARRRGWQLRSADCPWPLGDGLLFLHETGAGQSASLSAVAHYAAVRLRVTRERWLYQHKDVRGYERAWKC